MSARAQNGRMSGIPDLGPLGKRAVLVEWQTFPDQTVDPRFAERLASELRGARRAIRRRLRGGDVRYDGLKVCLWHKADISGRLAACPLSWVKRTSPTPAPTSAYDPKRTIEAYPPNTISQIGEPLGKPMSSGNRLIWLLL